MYTILLLLEHYKGNNIHKVENDLLILQFPIYRSRFFYLLDRAYFKCVSQTEDEIVGVLSRTV